MTKKVIQRIKAITAAHAPQAEVFLFGSRAKGNAKKQSDWDLLVLLNTPTIAFGIEIEFMDKFYELELELGAVISPLIYSKVQWNERLDTPLFKSIEKEAIKLQ